MFNLIRQALLDADCINSVEANRDAPKDGIIYFQLETDSEVAAQLKRFQPENSTILVEDGDIIEFDVRLGDWTPDDRSETMRSIRKAARTAARDRCLFITRVDSGGAGGFKPHVRCWEGPVPVDEFVAFLEALVMETKFLQTHGSSNGAGSSMA